MIIAPIMDGRDTYLSAARVALHQAAHLAAPDADKGAAVAYRAAPGQDAAVAGLDDPPLLPGRPLAVRVTLMVVPKQSVRMFDSAEVLREGTGALLQVTARP
ncbi:hypothetical protein TEQG_07641 [Trichophyton equinum CBS 127.97]|uniref:Uncharacterized protein n=1 Tax=Trichophyton equinum (strain ATCC MYA-4606 / CBS 127.97) TaxID=559882 RepID=F2Q3G4_TRIEC|nr:hypothetical protein TEQG_07641 [Trichophyton equinum CBS 127.97]